MVITLRERNNKNKEAGVFPKSIVSDSGSGDFRFSLSRRSFDVVFNCLFYRHLPSPLLVFLRDQSEELGEEKMEEEVENAGCKIS